MSGERLRNIFNPSASEREPWKTTTHTHTFRGVEANSIDKHRPESQNPSHPTMDIPDCHFIYQITAADSYLIRETFFSVAAVSIVFPFSVRCTCMD
jgi:hypothetical protein